MSTPEALNNIENQPDAQSIAAGKPSANMPQAAANDPSYVVAANDPTYTFDTSRFISDNRIHIEHSSLILASDPLLPLHPRELTPQNEPKLREKIKRAYTIDGYSFFDNDQRSAISAALSGLIPLSTQTKEALIGKQITDWMKELHNGADPEKAKTAEKIAEPFKAVMKQYLDKPEENPAVVEFSKNAVGMYLVMEEALHQHGFRGSIAQFTQGVSNAEGLVAKLSEYLSFDTHQFIDVARKDGLNGVGKLLGVDEAFLRDVNKLNEYLDDHKFSVNAVMNWQIGRHMPGMGSAGVVEKINAGAEARVNAKIMASRAALHHQYEVPAPIRQTEQTIAGMLKFLPSELAETLYLLGTEIAYTPERDLKSISPDIPAYGFHRRITQNRDDVNGIYHIFISGKHDAEEGLRVLVHEAHHLMLPNLYSAQEVQLVDSLASHDMLRLKALKEQMDQWMAGDDQTKAQVVATLNRPEFAVEGKPFSQMIGQAEMLTFYTQVQHAYQRLQIDSEFYHRSGYNSPESRFQEINSRYAELRYVRDRETPEMLQFMVPGLTVAYEDIYLPHIHNQLQDLRVRAAKEESKAPPSQPKTPGIAAAPTVVTTPKPVEQPTGAATGVAADIAEDYAVTSHPVGASTSIEAATADLQGQLFQRPDRYTTL